MQMCVKKVQKQGVSSWTSRDTYSQTGNMNSTFVSVEQFINCKQKFIGVICPEMTNANGKLLPFVIFCSSSASLFSLDQEQQQLFQFLVSSKHSGFGGLISCCLEGEVLRLRAQHFARKKQQYYVLDNTNSGCRLTWGSCTITQINMFPVSYRSQSYTFISA